MHGLLLTSICDHLEEQAGDTTTHQESRVCKVCSPSVLEQNPHGPEEACGGCSLCLQLLQRALGDGSAICLQIFHELALVALLQNRVVIAAALGIRVSAGCTCLALLCTALLLCMNWLKCMENRAPQRLEWMPPLSCFKQLAF